MAPKNKTPLNPPKRRSWITRIIRWMVGEKNHSQTPSVPQNTSSARASSRDQDITDAFQSIQFVLSENLEIIPYFGKIGAVFKKQGRQDGQRGRKNHSYHVLARSKVKGLVDDLKGKMVGYQKLLETSLIGKKIIATNAKLEYDENQKSLVRRNDHPREYSLLLARVYLFVALFLVFADIPLAVKLMEKGFDLTWGEPDISELFRKPLQVIQGNWETIVMALGIVLSSVFFKILYDEYVGGPVSHRATLIRRERTINPEDEADVRAVKRSYRFRALIKITILLVTLVTIIVLGLFRFYSSGKLTGTNSDYITLWTFILLTLIFPIISGVCFSYGMDRWLNHRENKRAEDKHPQLTQRYRETEEQMNETQSQLEKINSYLEWVQSDDFFDKYLDHLWACYEIGFEEGLGRPETNFKHHGYYGMLKQLRRKVVATQVNNSVSEGISSLHDPAKDRKSSSSHKSSHQ